MRDFSLLTGIQRYLRRQMSDQSIYLSVPPDAVYPYCAIDLEEIWQNVGHPEIPNARIKFRVCCWSMSVGASENIHQAAMIQRYLEGKMVDLENGMTAMIRHMETIKQQKMGGNSKCIIHIYEALIRGK